MTNWPWKTNFNKGRGFEPHRRHCVVSLSKKINLSLVLVQPRKTRPYITERLLMGRKESNQIKKSNFNEKVQPPVHCETAAKYSAILIKN